MFVVSIVLIVIFTGKNPQKIWDQMEEAIRLVVLKKEPQILKAVSKYPSKNNFFEMFRFDFVVDDELNVFLLEVCNDQLFSVYIIWGGIGRTYI